MLDGPIYARIFPYIRPLSPTTNFPFLIYPAQIVWPRSPDYDMKRVHMRDSFLRDAKFPSSDFSYDVQICPLTFALGLTHLYIPPCTEPSTLPNIQKSEV